MLLFVVWTAQCRRSPFYGTSESRFGGKMSVKEHGLTGQVCKVGVRDVVRNAAAWRAWLFLPIVALLFMVSSQVGAEEGFSVPNAVPPKGTYNGKHVEQPIEFPHDIHAKVNQINCLYCHTYARRSKVAGIPPTSKCMGCHSVIATDKPRIKKLTEYWEKREPPPWKKVHDVPDYVHFTHEKHLERFIFDNEGMPVEKASEVCAFCHGEVKNQTVAVKTKPLNMGFCVRCHEANKGPSDCWKCHK